jgi:DNA-binding PadR family transcriptional regulator
LEDLEKNGMVDSQVIQQEGKPNRKQYQITKAGRAELSRWVSTPLPVEAKREAWLIQVFFAHNVTNAEIASLFQDRIERLRKSLAECQLAQKHIDENSEHVGIKRLQNLWQLTLDYGMNYFENEIRWLEKTLPILENLPPMPSSRK